MTVAGIGETLMMVPAIATVPVATNVIAGTITALSGAVLMATAGNGKGSGYSNRGRDSSSSDGGQSQGSDKVKVGDWEYSDTAYHNGNGSRPYQDSPNTIKEIINFGPAGADPGKSNGLYWKVDGSFGGSRGTYELLLSSDGKTTWHFLFRTGK